MSEGVYLQVVGDKEWIRKLTRLEKRDSRRILRQAFRAGAKMIADKAKQLAPGGRAKGQKRSKATGRFQKTKGTGRLRKAIRVRAAKRSRRYIYYVARVGAEWFKGETFYAGFQEWGWHAGKRGRSSKEYRAAAQEARRRGATFRGRRFVKGKFFMKRAAQQTGRAAAAKAISMIRSGIEQAARQA